ncbi:hypothetical protein IL306_007250, partial [Fusarium sp. DS 682]
MEPLRDLDKDERRRTPYLALLVFTVRELGIEPEKVKKVMAKLPPDVKREQSDTYALRMHAGYLRYQSDVRAMSPYQFPTTFQKTTATLPSRRNAIPSPHTSSIGASMPTTTIVHLVSLTMDFGLTLPLPPSQRVAVLSLHSWTYTCLPSKNFTRSFDVLVNLSSKLTVLQPGASQEKKAPPARGQESDLEDERIRTLITRREKD